MKLVPVSEAKSHLSELIRDSDSDEVILMKHGRPAAVMVSARCWDDIQEQLEDLRDRVSISEREGVVVDFDKVMAELGLNV